MSILFGNNTVATLSQPISTAATAIPLTAGHGAQFPAISGPDRMLVTLANSGTETKWEVCEVVGRSGDTLTVIRGTSPQTFLAGDTVKCRWTSEHAYAAMNAHGVDMDFWLRRATGNVLSVAQSIVDDHGEDTVFHFAPNKTYDFGYEPLITSARGQSFVSAPGGRRGAKFLGGIRLAHRWSQAENLYLRGPTAASSPQLVGIDLPYNSSTTPPSDGIAAGTYGSDHNGQFQLSRIIVEGFDIGFRKGAASSWDRYFGLWVQKCFDVGVDVNLDTGTTYADYGDCHFSFCRFHDNPLAVLIRRGGGTTFDECKFHRNGLSVGGAAPVSGLYGGLRVEPTGANDQVQGVYVAASQFEDNDHDAHGAYGIYLNATGSAAYPDRLSHVLLTGSKVDSLYAGRCQDLTATGGYLKAYTLTADCKRARLVNVQEGTTGIPGQDTPGPFTDNSTDSLKIRMDIGAGQTGSDVIIEAKTSLKLQTSGTLTLQDATGSKTLSQI